MLFTPPDDAGFVGDNTNKGGNLSSEHLWRKHQQMRKQALQRCPMGSMTFFFSLFFCFSLKYFVYLIDLQ